MIILGIIAIIIGGVLYFNGNSINNDIDAQMESIFNDGISNPGSTYENIGIILIVIGFAFLIIGIIVRMNKKDDTSSNSTIKPDEVEEEALEEKMQLICTKCGAELLEDSKFCMECGQPVEPPKDESCDDNLLIVCPHCGETLPARSKFCLYCGGKIPNFLSNRF